MNTTKACASTLSPRSGDNQTDCLVPVNTPAVPGFPAPLSHARHSAAPALSGPSLARVTTPGARPTASGDFFIPADEVAALRSQIRDLAASGMGTNRIAAVVGRSANTVRKWANRDGIDLPDNRKVGIAAGVLQPTVMTPDVAAKAREFAAQGFCMRDTARFVGVSYKALATWARRKDVAFALQGKRTLVCRETDLARRLLSGPIDGASPERIRAARSQLLWQLTSRKNPNKSRDEAALLAKLEAAQ